MVLGGQLGLSRLKSTMEIIIIAVCWYYATIMPQPFCIVFGINCLKLFGGKLGIICLCICIKKIKIVRLRMFNGTKKNWINN